MTEFTKERIIEELKASTQNASGMFEISDDTICALMSMLTNAAPQLPQPVVEEIAMQNFRAAMEGIGHIRRTLEETFGGLHGTHCEPDVLVECKEICDAIYEACRKTAPVTPDCSANILRRWLAFGRAMQSSGSQLPRHLIAETESMLAAAPQQDVRLALEIGMSRYAGAMQKLVDSGD